MFTIIITIIFSLLLIAALISATETAITASSSGKIQQLINGKNKRAKLVKSLLKIKDKIISSLLIGNSLANTLCTTLATSIFIDIFGDETGTIISSIVMSFVIIIFSEVIPKAIAVTRPEKVAMMAAPFLVILLKILNPLVILLNYIVRFFCWIFRINLKQEMSGADEVRGMIEHHLIEGTVDQNDGKMLGGILDIKNLVVGDIMIHRSKIFGIDIDEASEKNVNLILNSGHSRIPVWKDNTDNIIGILLVRDLFKLLKNSKTDLLKLNLKDIMQEPWFVSDNTPLTQQLHAFREGQSHLACVVDEYGDLQGLITLEDVIEEVVGQINDENDPKNPKKLFKISDKEFIVDGTIHIRELNRDMRWNLPEDNATTIAGFIIHEMRKIPNKGEIFIYDKFKFAIKAKVRNRVTSVKVFLLEENQD